MVAVGDIHHSFFTAQVLNGFPAKKKWYIHGVVKTDLYGVVVDINLYAYGFPAHPTLHTKDRSKQGHYNKENPHVMPTPCFL